MSKSYAFCRKCGEWNKPLIKGALWDTAKGKVRNYICRPCNTAVASKCYKKDPTATRRAIKKSTRKYPQKQRARVVVNHAIKKGVLLKPPACAWCSGRGRIEGHHIDYHKPLEVIWLCTACHTVADRV